MNPGEHEHAARVQRLREALGEPPDDGTTITVLTSLGGGLIQCTDITSEGVSTTVATFSPPRPPQTEEDQP